ncbi:extracellular solute-binding protein [Paenibacillus spongiae]|uniref:Extracellular solute-binding protein n=1 Tax=Paenibacillus spongiae TaxID=2909671 RepID=A0ABY5S956_9BACL|nr:extracellular solute-binding protein [Paenibacillus spongiae]UVI30452.1 extracellular solute-binding protein [Paenibacillus spongiae]
MGIRLSKGIKTALALTLTAALFTGCANRESESPGNSSNSKPASKESSAGSGHYSLYAPTQTTPINLDGRITKVVMEKSGIRWNKVEIGNGGDVAQQINLKLVSGDFPDAIILPADSLMWSRLIDEKKLLPLDDYFDNAADYPNLAKIDKRIIDNWRAADGHIYFVPSGYEPVVEEPAAWQGNAQGLWIQNTILEKSGMTYEDLRTVEGFEKFLNKIKDFKDAQGRKIIPLSLGGENFAGLDVVMSMFGVVSGGNGWNEQADGTVLPDYQLPGFKQAFQWLNSLHLKGLLDPETAFQKKDLFKEKANNLRFGAMLFGGWDNPNLTILKNKGIPDTISYKALERQGFPGGWFIPTYLPANPGVKFAQYASFNPFGGSGTGISAKVENPDVLMKGLDWMQTPEAFILMEYGPEELGAHKMEDGVVIIDNDVFYGPEFWGGDAGGMAKVTEHGFWWWKNLASTLMTHIKTMEPTWPATNAMLYKAEELNHEQGTYGLIPQSSRIKPIIGGAVEKYSPVQNDIRLQYYAKLLLAKSEKNFEDTFNQFLNEMKVRGHDAETIAEFNKEYKAYSDTPAGKIEVTIKRSLPRNVYNEEPVIIGE